MKKILKKTFSVLGIIILVFVTCSCAVNGYKGGW